MKVIGSVFSGVREDKGHSDDDDEAGGVEDASNIRVRSFQWWRISGIDTLPSQATGTPLLSVGRVWIWHRPKCCCARNTVHSCAD